MPTFAELGVPAGLCAALTRRGIAEPFPIQALTLPDALAGRDICGRAPTGSGKTLAFGLALVTRIGPARPGRPSALVLVPTRELAAQVASELDALLPPAGGSGGPRRSSRKGHRGQKVGRDADLGQSGQVVAIYGGASYGPQRRALARGAAIVVACPGRLEDLLEQGDVSLDGVDVVVLDEADRMADMGFLPAVRRLLDRTKPDRQTMLFSATLDGDIDALVRRYQNDPARHEVVTDEERLGDVEHLFWRAKSSAHRVELVGNLIRTHGRAMVFCRTRRGADRLAKQLKAFGVDSAAIHGNRTQGQRERALAAFTKGKVSALVATDVAARGIHVDAVACVVHFDLPADPKDYIHRSGRTGRAGATGTVVTLVTDEHRRAARTLQRALDLPQELVTPHVIGAKAVEVEATVDERFEPARTHKPKPSNSARRPRPTTGGPGADGPRRRPRRPQAQGQAPSGRSGGRRRPTRSRG